MRRSLLAGVVAAVLVTLLAACGGSSGRAQVADRAEPGPASSAAPGGTPVPPALRFSAPGVDGGRVDGAHFAGRDVALWFWAPW